MILDFAPMIAAIPVTAIVAGISGIAAVLVLPTIAKKAFGIIMGMIGR